MRILFVGDVVGRPGRRAVRHLLPELRARHNVDLCVVNGENVAGGHGINERCCRELTRCGADIVTLGNHAFDNREVYQFIDKDDRVIRPLNLPPGNPGFAEVIHQHEEGAVVIVTLCGRVFMQPFDCPFRALDDLVERHRTLRNPRFIVDFHAEATSEKSAFALYADGRVSAIIGTHTHIPTADERILPGGTAYVTDVGMTGPYHSVIGMRLDPCLKRLVQLHPSRLDVAREDVRLAAALIDLDPGTGMARSIERMLIPLPPGSSSKREDD